MVVVSVFSGNEALSGSGGWPSRSRPGSWPTRSARRCSPGARGCWSWARAVRSELEPALLRLGLDHEWVTSGAAAARVCAERRFEVALVDAGMRDPRRC